MRHKHQRRGWGRVRNGIVALLALAFLTTSLAHAEWELILSRDPAKPPAAEKKITQLRVRPNAEERVYLFVQNTEITEPEEVTVRLYQPKPGGDPKLLTEKTLRVEPNKAALIRFGKAEPEGKPADPKKPPEFTPLTPSDNPKESTFSLHWEVLQKGAKEPEKKGADKLRTISVRVLEPREELELGARFDLKARTLTVNAKAKSDFSAATGCTLDLDLSQVENLIQDSKKGTYTRKLKAGEEVQLVASNLGFRGPAPEKGRVYLTVDGMPRAVAFDIAFTIPTAGVVQPTDQPLVRLPASKIISKAKEKVPLTLDVYNAKDFNEDIWLNIFVDRNRDNERGPDEVVRKRGAREQQLSVSAADPSGGLLFKSQVHDWPIELDTSGLYGTVPVEVSLRDKEEKELAKSAVAKGELLIDDSAPEILEFVAATKDPLRGDQLTFRVRAKDDDTKISRVLFFLGEPKEGKAGKELPMETEKGVQVGDTDQWEAQLSMPDRKGKVTVGVQVVNEAGLAAYAPLSVILSDPPPGKPAGEKKYKISGKIIENKLAQPDLEVVLRDDKGMVKGTVKTASDKKGVGTFTFENVAPGTYIVSSSKVGSNTKGEQKVVVEAADVTGVNIELFR